MNKIIPFMGVASVVLLLSCGKKKEEADDKQMEMQEQVMNETYVDTMQLHAQEFNKQIVCNGKLNCLVVDTCYPESILLRCAFK